jgi:hypothetical protein
MAYMLTADLILVLHFLFILFVLFGGFLCLHRIRWIWLHLTAVVWGVWVEWANMICPLTPLENHYRQQVSGQEYSEGFIEHYLVPLIYPEQLTDSLRYFLGALVLIVNLIIYLYVFRKRKKRVLKVDE